MEAEHGISQAGNGNCVADGGWLMWRAEGFLYLRQGMLPACVGSFTCFSPKCGCPAWDGILDRGRSVIRQVSVSTFPTAEQLRQRLRHTSPCLPNDRAAMARMRFWQAHNTLNSPLEATRRPFDYLESIPFGRGIPTVRPEIGSRRLTFA